MTLDLENELAEFGIRPIDDLDRDHFVADICGKLCVSFYKIPHRSPIAKTAEVCDWLISMGMREDRESALRFCGSHKGKAPASNNELLLLTRMVKAARDIDHMQKPAQVARSDLWDDVPTTMAWCRNAFFFGGSELCIHGLDVCSTLVPGDLSSQSQRLGNLKRDLASPDLADSAISISSSESLSALSRARSELRVCINNFGMLTLKGSRSRNLTEAGDDCGGKSLVGRADRTSSGHIRTPRSHQLTSLKSPTSSRKVLANAQSFHLLSMDAPKDTEKILQELDISLSETIELHSRITAALGAQKRLQGR